MDTSNLEQTGRLNLNNVEHDIRMQGGPQRGVGAGKNNQRQGQNILEDLVELAAQGVFEVRVEPVQGVLPQVGHFIP